MKKDHIEYLNIAKGILIILIVAGHANGPYRNFLYLFHVAAFFFISGIFYKDSYIKAPFIFIWKRIKSLYIPFVAYVSAFVLTHNFFVYIGFYNREYGYNEGRSVYYSMIETIRHILNAFTFGITEQFLVPLWFITSLFTIQMIMIGMDVILERIAPKRKDTIRTVVITICFAAGMLMTRFNIDLPRFFNVSLVALGIFYAGYIFKRYEEKVTYKLVYAVCLFFLLVLNSFYGTIQMAGNTYPNPAFLIVNTFAGVYVVLYISKLFENKHNVVNRFLIYAGNNSFHILALHYLAFKIASLIIIPIKGYPYEMVGSFPIIHAKAHWWVLYAVLGVILPLIVVYTIQTGYKLILNLYENSRVSKGHK